jgi:hypothetical protein
VIFTSVESAVARSEMAGATTVQICGQASDLVLDAQGKPLTHRHTCPHCLQAQGFTADLPPAPVTWTALRGAARALALPPVAPTATLAPPRGPEARGPPILI